MIVRLSRGCFLFLAAALLQPAFAETRVALVIGNAHYQEATPLANPVNDANLMKRVLELAKFDVIVRADVNQASLMEGIDEFVTRLRADRSAVGLVYYSGHGVQVDGVNYLVPIDASGKDTADMIPIDPLLQKLASEGNATSIIILDACRNNPFPSSRSLNGPRNLPIARGLARVEASYAGTYIAYATSPGEVATDGSGSNSPYTAALAEFMQQPGLSLEAVFKQVRLRVLKETSNKQKPWELSSLTREFYFRNAPQLNAPSSGTNCLAQPGPYQVVGVAGNDVLNIREQAGQQFRIVSTLRPGTSGITLEECKGSWCRIRHECSTGWAMSKFLGRGPGETAVESFSYGMDSSSQGLFRVSGVQFNDQLNVRGAPGASAALRGSIPPDAGDVEVHECNGANRLDERWCYVSFAGVEGWAHARFLVSQEDDESHPR